MRGGEATGSAAASALRMGLLLVLGLVLLARGMEYLNQRITDASRAPRRDGLARALESSVPGARESALRQLRALHTTPELQASLAAAASRAGSPSEQRFIACLRGRDPDTPLTMLFDALPTEPPAAGAWHEESVECLLDGIAARAHEDPGRAAPVLAGRALLAERAAIIEALLRLDPQPLPPEVVQAAERATNRTQRESAIRVAVALGAARTAPDAVRRWLDDPERGVRLAVLRTLIARHDDDSQANAARALASNPGDADLESLAMAELRKGEGLDGRLAAVAADPAAPNFARAQAAYLVSSAGGEAAARAVVAVPAADATLEPELDAAVRRVAQRFGAAGGRR